LKGVGRFVAISLIVLSGIYFITRVQSYYELKDYKEKNNRAMIGSVGERYDNY